jgi:Mrp family chromosome partitioning ATPase
MFLRKIYLRLKNNTKGETCIMSEQCSHDCGSCSQDCASRKKDPKDFIEKLNEHSHVKKVIGVVSGKGGVGKSMVTLLMSVLSRRAGMETAILDADITGPSIPKALGIEGKAVANEKGLLPAISKTGIKVMSVNLLLEDTDSPVVWRGPVLAGAVKQFWTDVVWDDVDFMFVDMPPGTGDVPLTVFQSLPLDGIIIVTSPQELVSMIVAKAVKMARMMNIPILGVIENMSYLVCPDCGKKIEIYGKSHLEETASKYGLDILGRIPINSRLAEACDNGQIEFFEGDWADEAAKRVLSLLK